MSYLFLILATLFWSGNFVISRGMHADIPPLSLSLWRWLAALVILCLFAGRRFFQQRTLVKKHIAFITIQGLLGVAAFNTLIYLAVQSTTAINAVLINSCIPVLIVLCSLVLYRETMSVRQYLGVLISLAGVLLIIARGDFETLREVSFNPGDILVLVAALVWALYSTNLKKYPKELHPFTYQTGIVITGLLFILPFYIGEISLGKGMSVTVSTVATIFYVALFASVLAFIFWNKAVRHIGANRAGPFIHLMPVFSTILAVIFLGESLEGYHFKGIGLIFIGITMTTVKIRKGAS
ncbi:MAG: EamA family transporter [Proteobacteria bacterium]|nr:MAG: EamA family transporter [Pseudomonadota bacterium]